ncbi:MAG: HAMP domain-containing sensor histidine kinase [Sulfurospirillaceae bacterium]|nr:HAMP domain-containing sensor histidine kinase [Sulfurospirillaceae bacterium]MDD2825648.1 HAMP domain-containing sensor histidine kinase [Sulfurospirillaceae bacterium]
MREKKHKSINQINFMAILFAGLFAFISACIIIVNEYLEFNKEMAILETTYIQSQKKSAQVQINHLNRIISYRYEQSKQLPQEEIYQKLIEDVRYLTADMDTNNYIFVTTQEGRKLYTSNQLDANQSDKDIVVTQEYPPLSLVLGSGVSTRSIEDVMAQKKEDYQTKIINFILKIYMLTLLLYIISTVEYRYVSDIMGREIRFIVESFKDVSRSYHTMDMEKINFKEFREIASQANFMIDKIKEKNSALLELNSTLETMVTQKTQELKKSVDFTQELLERQDRFVKNAIHEINTPLSIILMNIDLYNLKFEKNRYLVKIEAAVKVLDNIYEDLAYLVKKDRVVYTPEMINFSQFIADRVDYFHDVAEGNKLIIESDIESDIFILFNETELQRICDNNISNAIKYSYEGKSLHVRLKTEKTHIILEIENCGEPINFPDKLFDRYYREDEARGGFGLGLNIVREICDEKNITIKIESDKEHTLFRYIFETKGWMSDENFIA